ncbi:MAG: 50S ribosomal protein L21 [Myxococcota bacterium]|nr:50S ribosomal protein L21 [Myxococcota bacterium]
MYAVIATGGKQYAVKTGDILRVEKLPGEPGAEIRFDKVLFVGGDSIKIGQPAVAGAVVTAKIRFQERAKKIIVFKRKRREGFHKTIGHRQPYTEVAITDIRA